MRNILGDIPLAEIPITFFQIFRHLEPGGVILNIDTMRFWDGELDRISWCADDFVQLFPRSRYLVEPLSDAVPADELWTAISASRQPVSESIEIWRQRTRRLARAKLKALRQALADGSARAGHRLVHAHCCHMMHRLSAPLGAASTPAGAKRDEPGLEVGDARFSVVGLVGDGSTAYSRGGVVCRLPGDSWTRARPVDPQDAAADPIARWSDPPSAPSAVGLRGYSFEIEGRPTPRLILSVEKIGALAAPSSFLKSTAAQGGPGAAVAADEAEPDPNLVVLHDSRRNELGVAMMLWTARDNRLLYAKAPLRDSKSHKVYGAPIISDVDAVGLGYDAPDPFLTANRHARARYGLELDTGLMKVLGLVRTVADRRPYLVGFGKIDASTPDVLANLVEATSSRQEPPNLLSMPLDLELVAQHLRENCDLWQPECAAAALFTLNHVFGVAETAAAFGAVPGERFGRDLARSYEPPIRRQIRRYVAGAIGRFGIQGAIADVGSGYRSSLEELALTKSNIRLITVDENPFVGADLVESAENMKSVRSKSMDAVICSELLEHVWRPGEVIRELARVLKPGGHAIFTVPFAVALHGRKGLPDLWRFSPEGLEHLVSRDFVPLEIVTTGDAAAPTGVFMTCALRTSRT